MSYTLSSPVEVEGDGVNPGQVELSDGTNSVTVAAPVGLSGPVDFTLPNSNGTNGQVLSRGATNLEWTTVGTFNSSSTLPVLFNFSATGNGAPARTNSSSFVTFARFVYNGTGTDNTMTSSYFIVATTNASGVGEIQVSDETNATVIGTATGWSSSPSGTLFIVSLASISNLPVGQAILSISLRKVSGGGQVQMYSAQFLG